MATHLRTWWTYWLGTGGAEWDGLFDACGQVRVYLESQNPATNSSYIRIDHYLVLKRGSYDVVAAFDVVSSYRANNGSYGELIRVFQEVDSI